jgi:uncharacterized membrane protein
MKDVKKGKLTLQKLPKLTNKNKRIPTIAKTDAAQFLLWYVCIAAVAVSVTFLFLTLATR